MTSVKKEEPTKVEKEDPTRTTEEQKKKKKKRNRKKKSKLDSTVQAPQLNQDGKIEFKPVAKIPQAGVDASANWKLLKQVLKPDAPPIPKSDKVNEIIRKKREAKKQKALTSQLSAGKSELWFDDVDETLLEDDIRPQEELTETVIENSETIQQDPTKFLQIGKSKGVTKYLGIDCEMVGVDSSRESIVARVSIVNQFGTCIYDKYVKPTEKITDFRTAVSGIRAEDLRKAEPFSVVQKEVSDLLDGKILVGHAVQHDMKVLMLGHPRNMTRDTSTYKGFRKLFGGKTPSLKNLSAKLLGVDIQKGEHSSVQDAQAAMRLYTMYKSQWEQDIKDKRRYGRTAGKTTISFNKK